VKPESDARSILDAITGGLDPETYIAQLRAAVEDELRLLREDLREGLAP
jgi:hypothetical protein